MTEQVDQPVQTIPARKEKRYQKIVRKKVVVEELQDDAPNPEDYEPVTFRFYNDQQKGVPVYYNWTDKWTKIGECKGYMYDGGIYTLPRIAYEYYKNQCWEPVYSNESAEIVPGQTSLISKRTGKTYRFRMDELPQAK